MFKAILFDMDGVLVDTRSSVTQFWQQLATKEGLSLSEDDLNSHVYGSTATNTLSALFPSLSETHKSQVLRSLRDYENALSYFEIPGVTSLLRALKRDAIPVALVTSAESAKVDVVLSQLGLTEMFEVRVHSGEMRVPKPDPSCYLLASSRLGVDPERCIVFEDAIVGVQAAVRAGATCIAVGQYEPEADLLIAGAVAVIANFRDVRIEYAAPNASERSTLFLCVKPHLNLPIVA